MNTVSTPVDRLSSTFAALADPTRRAILARLSRGETHVGELAQPFRMSAPAISRHLRVLEQAGLIERRVQAQWRLCGMRPEALRGAHRWLEDYRQYWEGSLDRLVDYVEAQAAPPPVSPPPPPATTTPKKEGRA